MLPPHSIISAPLTLKILSNCSQLGEFSQFLIHNPIDFISLPAYFNDSYLHFYLDLFSCLSSYSVQTSLIKGEITFPWVPRYDCLQVTMWLQDQPRFSPFPAMQNLRVKYRKAVVQNVTPSSPSLVKTQILDPQTNMGFHISWRSGQASARQCRKLGFNPWVGKIPWRRK